MAKGRYQKWLESENLILLEGWKRNGLTDEQIAGNMGISINTLNKWKQRFVQIRQALKIGHETANLAVERELFKKAMKGNTTAMVFWLKNNWRDKYNDSELSKEERDLVIQRGKKLQAETSLTELKVKALKEGDKSTEEAVDRLMKILEGDIRDEHEHQQSTDN